ncbi:GMC oxidoreductase [Larkinella terrae]|uniref:GMC family oxidoreductase n=1 Tax=Larkinella terrae TaxID=2025311 RepID=A0A7K0EKZ8_9BACT|nr:GMC family oxidoreductase [Larkinella terrae]MRS62211.1 GMC family oxidoreductase [Larkinella terrae]
MNPVFINTKGKKEHTFDAIVVGSGISGGWSAKELCERGLKTLVLERGRHVEHITDYPTAMKSPWEFPNRLTGNLKDQAENPVQSSCSAYSEDTKQFFVNDREHPYIQEKPFSWIRGYQVGGRSLTWGRQCYRLSDLDFEANAKEGIAVDWPIRYKDLAPWYGYVEKFVGISGQAEGLSHLPDGQFLPPMELNCIETHFAKKVRQNYKDRLVTIARTANLTRGWNGRGPCQYRNLCSRGCPYGGYFSSNSATLPAAAATGNLTLRPDSIVTEVLLDEKTNRATGVRVIDAHTKQVTDYFARIIFLNASTIATTAILLNSTSRRFPNGLGNTSGQIGHNLMDHFMMGGAMGEHADFGDQYYAGRRPIGFYVPRFRNINAQTQRPDYRRGFAYQGDGERAEWSDRYKLEGGFGADFKAKLAQPGPWTIFIGAWGETLPYDDNRVSLDDKQTDQWGLPLVRVNFEYRENEINMRKDIKESAGEMLTQAGFRNVQQFYYDLTPGSAVHEMGTARMGHDPKTSVLNGFNQMHDVKNVYITDGSCMTSSACQNPSLTYMALTARACAHAVDELKKLNL